MTPLTPLMPGSLATVSLEDYGPILILLAMAVTFAVANIVLSLIIGPRRDGKVKELAYESGMNPIGTARKRFNVRFYLIAVTFLVFDVEVIFLYPWAITYANVDPASPEATLFLFRVLFFMLTTVIAYVYGYRKGVFRFD